MSSAASIKRPATPRPSASLVVVNERNEVLLVGRNPKASTFAGVHVFPGGNFDEKQDASLRMTAIRETFEESGLLLASPSSAAGITESARHDIHSQKKTFPSFLNENQLEADTQSLLQFTQWITPVDAPRRFHTRFFVAFLPSSASTGFSSGQKVEQIPTPDGGQEVISARFLPPSVWISLFDQKKIAFMPPQYYILYTLASLPADSLRERVQQLSEGAFGKMVLNPRRLPGSVSEDGKKGILTYEGDESRGGKEGRLHRAKCEFTKGGITTKIELQRNFDIFNEIEGHLFQPLSKL